MIMGYGYPNGRRTRREQEKKVVDEKSLDEICRNQFGGDNADDCDYDGDARF
jgi:hypothetical protein